MEGRRGGGTSGQGQGRPTGLEAVRTNERSTLDRRPRTEIRRGFRRDGERGDGGGGAGRGGRGRGRGGRGRARKHGQRSAHRLVCASTLAETSSSFRDSHALKRRRRLLVFAPQNACTQARTLPPIPLSPSLRMLPPSHKAQSRSARPIDYNTALATRSRRLYTGQPQSAAQDRRTSRAQGSVLQPIRLASARQIGHNTALATRSVRLYTGQP